MSGEVFVEEFLAGQLDHPDPPLATGRPLACEALTAKKMIDNGQSPGHDEIQVTSPEVGGYRGLMWLAM